jgi:benzoate/toluate 1,2-dioxygenase alpha subunit
MIATDTFAELAQGDRVHRRVYTDPEIFEAEMQRIFARTWLFIGHESEVPHHGDYKTDTIARRPVIMVRGADNAVRLFYNTCRHRGSKVCTEAYGSGTRFRCAYHGWTFNTEGKLIGVPMREQMRDFDFPADFGLIAVPRVESYRGFVFASLNPDVIPLREHLGRGCDYLDLMCDRAPDGEIEALRPIKYNYAGNWKFQIENYADNYHPPVLHQTALEVGAKMLREKYSTTKVTMKGIRTRYTERGYASGHGMCDFANTRGPLWMNGYENPAYLEALRRKHTEEKAQELLELDLHMMIYPNLLLHTRMNHYRVIKPLAVNRTEIWAYPCNLKGAPADVNETLALHTSHHCSPMGEVQVDDLQAFTWISEGLQAEEMEWCLLKLYGAEHQDEPNGEFACHSPSEGILRYQYREWSRLMAAG